MFLPHCRILVWSEAIQEMLHKHGWNRGHEALLSIWWRTASTNGPHTAIRRGAFCMSTETRCFERTTFIKKKMQLMALPCLNGPPLSSKWTNTCAQPFTGTLEKWGCNGWSALRGFLGQHVQNDRNELLWNSKLKHSEWALRWLETHKFLTKPCLQYNAHQITARFVQNYLFVCICLFFILPASSGQPSREPIRNPPKTD